ncbi:MAG TPA: twitch domain-containing radical SAM protein [Longimicrobiaceae bacterium]
MSQASLFPVRSPTACLLKWGWSSLYIYTGQSNSCHRTTQSELTASDLPIFHNTPAKLEQRRIMAEGGWPARGNGCEYCKDIEDAGGMSDRLANLALLEQGEEYRELIPPELLSDPAALAVTPTMLEVYFTNRCNMACIYCGPNYSTQWVAENKVHGVQPQHTRSVSWETARKLDREYPERLRRFWEWLEEHYAALRMLHVLGGEPFHQVETEDTIRFFDAHPNPRLHLKIFSNLKVRPDRFRHLLGELKKLHDGGKCRSVGIVASLDCWGPPQEYVRHGLELDNWTENYEHLVFEHPWADVSINSTMNALSIRAMPELVRRVRHWNDARARIHHGAPGLRGLSLVFNLLTGPPFMHAGIFPEGFFDEEFAELVELLPDDTPWARSNVEYMHGIWKTVNATPHNPELIRTLKAYLDEIDRRRGLSWRAVFPWLVDVD